MSVKDDQRRVYEARIWRLSFLLTGDTRGATELVGRVLRAQPDVLDVEPVRLDRLVILQAREWSRSRRGRVVAPGSLGAEAAEALGAALSMDHQLLEAWVLARVDGMEGLSISRAMDCSNTASAMHLAEADRVMAAKLGAKLPAGLDALRAGADKLDPRPFIDESRAGRRRRGLRRTIILFALLGAVVLGLWIAVATGALPTFKLPSLW
jgi:hypothetical protein